jgi:hypothetical protein
MHVILKTSLAILLITAAAGPAALAATTSTTSSTSTTDSNISTAKSAAAAAAGAAIGQAAVGGVPYGYVRPEPDKPVVNTTGASCQCQVGETSGSACMIFMRTSAADWIRQNAPQTRMRSSNDGRYYDAPFPLAASACAGREVNPATVKVHWLDRKNAILEWK